MLSHYKYVYDGDGNIVRSIDISGKKGYNYEYEEILRETWEDNTLVPLFDNEDSVCGILYNNVPYYFIKNLQGDIIAIVDKDAKTVARYSYDAWGVCTVILDSVGIANINPFRYRGYYYMLQEYNPIVVVGALVARLDFITMITIERNMVRNLFQFGSILTF